MELPRAFNIQSTIWLLRGFQGLYGLTLLMAIFAPIDIVLNSLLVILLVALWWLWGRQQQVRFGRIVAARLLSPLEWQLSYADGPSMIGEVTHCQIWVGLIVLRFKLEQGGAESLLLTQRCIDPQVHRRLRAWLRLVQPANR